MIFGKKTHVSILKTRGYYLAMFSVKGLQKWSIRSSNSKTKVCKLPASVGTHWKFTHLMEVKIKSVKASSLKWEKFLDVSLRVVIAPRWCLATRQFCSTKCSIDLEQVAYDPKDSDLCLSRAKSYESVVEARSDSDVQIDRLTQV